jgi:hypothetical protein
MISRSFVFVAAFFAGSVSAQPIADVEWSQPTARENGEALTPEDIGGYRLYKSSPDGPVMLAEVTGTQHELTIDAGECYTLTVTAFDTLGLESQPSNGVDVCASLPVAPTNLIIKMR